MTLAHPSALPRLEVAPVPLIVDDAFYEYAREHSLPDCSVSFLMLAGSWSARNSRSGFVPSTVLADFSDDPDLITRTLSAARIVRRVSGGVRITEGRGLTVVNASDVLRDIERDKASAEQRRAVERERKRRYRTAKAAERREDSVPRVPPESRGTSTGVPPGVPPGSPGNPGKPQVTSTDVPRDICGTSRGTSRGTPASDDQDPDQDQSGVNQVSQLRDRFARTREHPDVINAAIEELCPKAGCVVTEDQAGRALGIIERRARNSRTSVLTDWADYARTAIRRERDVWAEMLCPPAAELEVIHAAPDPADADRHEFKPGGLEGRCLECDFPKFNRRFHREARPA
jgi:hypothetical protein